MKSYSNILCPYQQSIRLCVSDTWRLNKNMMVQMPTGIGKLHSLASSFMSICKNGKGKVCGLPPTVVNW